VTFNTSPNFEAPADLNGDNAYQIIVHANDGVHDTTQAVTISVTDTNDVAPTITSAATASEAENTAAAHRGLHRDRDRSRHRRHRRVLHQRRRRQPVLDQQRHR